MGRRELAPPGAADAGGSGAGPALPRGAAGAAGAQVGARAQALAAQALVRVHLGAVRPVGEAPSAGRAGAAHGAALLTHLRDGSAEGGGWHPPTARARDAHAAERGRGGRRDRGLLPHGQADQHDQGCAGGTCAGLVHS